MKVKCVQIDNNKYKCGTQTTPKHQSPQKNLITPLVAGKRFYINVYKSKNSILALTVKTVMCCLHKIVILAP